MRLRDTSQGAPHDDPRSPHWPFRQRRHKASARLSTDGIPALDFLSDTPREREEPEAPIRKHPTLFQLRSGQCRFPPRRSAGTCSALLWRARTCTKTLLPRVLPAHLCAREEEVIPHVTRLACIDAGRTRFCGSAIMEHVLKFSERIPTRFRAPCLAVQYSSRSGSPRTARGY